MPLPPFPDLPDDPMKATRLRWKYLLALLQNVAVVWGFIYAVLAASLGVTIAAHFGVDIDPFLSWASDFFPLALAITGIILTLKKLNEEHHNAVILLLIVVGIAGTVVLHLSRTHESTAHQKEVSDLRDRMDSVRDQNSKVLQGLVIQGPQSSQDVEVARRQNIEKTLRNEYILSHKDVSAGLLAGTEFPPAEWMNQRLSELGEKWSMSSTQSTQVGSMIAPPKSYLTFDGQPWYPDKTNIRQDADFQVGDLFFINYSFKSLPTNPNPVQVESGFRWLYVEPDYSPATQQTMVADFVKRTGDIKNSKSQKQSSIYAMLPGDSRWDSVKATDDGKSPKFITQPDLDALHTGTKIIFIMLEIPYRDGSRLHHLRACEFLQPPAMNPKVWHFCSVTFTPD